MLALWNRAVQGLDMSVEDFDAPLFQALVDYVDQQSVQFHMPGHKKGMGMPPEIAQYLSEHILEMDTTETRGMDNLHSPSACIKRAQDLAAQAVGADRTFFLTNGTTAGVQAMIMTVCREGSSIIIPRDAHLAVIGSTILADLRPAFVYPDIDPEWGVGMGVPVSEYERALDENPDASACLITRPNYYGIATNLAPLAELCRKRGVPLLVDEAHGAHLPFHEALPKSGLEYGADMVVHSTHKTLSSFTGSSMLHITGGRIDPDRVQRMLSILQSTSPSYLLMVSLDIAATIMRTRGRELLGNALEVSRHIRRRLSGIQGIRVLEKPGMDILRLTVSMTELGLTGHALKNILIDRHNIRVELSDMENIIAFITIADTVNSGDILADALIEISESRRDKQGSWTCPVSQAEFKARLLSPARRAMLPRRAALSSHEVIPISMAEGRVAAEVVAPYPPGIPLLYPGEVIDSAKLDIMQESLSLGAVFRGLAPGEELSVTVVKEEYR